MKCDMMGNSDSKKVYGAAAALWLCHFLVASVVLQYMYMLDLGPQLGPRLGNAFDLSKIDQCLAQCCQTFAGQVISISGRACL